LKLDRDVLVSKKLFKCPDCQSEISRKAAACPHCGSPIAKKKREGLGCGGLLGIVLLGTFALVMLVDTDSGTAAKKAVAEKKAPPPPKSAAEIRREKIERGFSGWDGSHRALERWIKKRLKDPGSYEHIETRFGDKGDHVLVITTYRARNSFGGYTVESVTAKARIDGSLIAIVSAP